MPRCCFVTCGPNEVLVVSGCCIRKSQMIAGGRVFVWPIFQEVLSLPLNIMTLHVESPMVYTIQGVPISVTGIAQIKIQGQNKEMLDIACEMFLGKNETEIATIALVTLEGHQRAIMGAMTVEEIYQDRKKFSENVFEVASSDLINMGITVVSYTIKDISDDEGYLKALGMARTAEVKRDARIGEATAKRDATMRGAHAEMERINARLKNDTEIARSKRDYQLKKCEYEVESLKKKAEAEMAFSLQEAKIKQRLAEEKVTVDIRERAEQIILEQEEIKRKTQELKSSINVAADAEKFRLETIAKAKREAVVLEAEGEAESIRVMGEAEAFAIKTKAKAEAHQMREKAEALNQYSEAAVMDMVLDSLPKVAEEVAARLSETNKITIVSSGPGEIGPAKITQEIFSIICKVPEAIRLLTGLDITRSFPIVSSLFKLRHTINTLKYPGASSMRAHPGLPSSSMEPRIFMTVSVETVN